MTLADHPQMGLFAQKKPVCKSLKKMELVSGLEPPFGLRITNGNEENDEND
jgi:hypothetical protein